MINYTFISIVSTPSVELAGKELGSDPHFDVHYIQGFYTTVSHEQKSWLLS